MGIRLEEKYGETVRSVEENLKYVEEDIAEAVEHLRKLEDEIIERQREIKYLNEIKDRYIKDLERLRA